MSQILTNIQPDDRLAHRITDAAVFAGHSRNASQLAVRYEPIVALRLDPQNPRLHSRKSVRQTDLRPYGRDARLHSRKRVRQIANRVRTFGFTSPVLIDSQNIILAGHRRVEAATLPTMANVPCVLAETMTPAAIIGWLRGAVMSTFQEMGSSMSAELVYRLANAFFGLDRAELDIIASVPQLPSYENLLKERCAEGDENGSLR